jgi:hypothetical protein
VPLVKFIYTEIYDILTFWQALGVSGIDPDAGLEPDTSGSGLPGARKAAAFFNQSGSKTFA